MNVILVDVNNVGVILLLLLLLPAGGVAFDNDNVLIKNETAATTVKKGVKIENFTHEETFRDIATQPTTFFHSSNETYSAEGQTLFAPTSSVWPKFKASPKVSQINSSLRQENVNKNAESKFVQVHDLVEFIDSTTTTTSLQHSGACCGALYVHKLVPIILFFNSFLNF